MQITKNALLDSQQCFQNNKDFAQMDQADILCLITGNLAAKLGQRSQQPSITVCYTYIRQTTLYALSNTMQINLNS